MFLYLSKGGPNDGRMVTSRFDQGYVLTDMANELGKGAPWVWIYKRQEVWVPDGVDDEGEPKMDFRGYRFEVEDENGEPFDPEKAAHTAEGPSYDILAYDNGVVEDGLQVGL